MSKIIPTSAFKWINPKEFDLNKYIRNSSEGCVLELDREYPKALCELHNDCPLVPDKIIIIREMLCIYQLRIADIDDIPIDNAK